jgi:hypothetical protein
MIAPLRRLHRRLWIVWAVVIAAAAAIILAAQP